MNMRLHSGRFIYRGNKQLGQSLVITKRYSFDKNNTFLVCVSRGVNPPALML